MCLYIFFGSIYLRLVGKLVFPAITNFVNFFVKNFKHKEDISWSLNNEVRKIGHHARLGGNSHLIIDWA